MKRDVRKALKPLLSRLAIDTGKEAEALRMKLLEMIVADATVNACSRQHREWCRRFLVSNILGADSSDAPSR